MRRGIYDFVLVGLVLVFTFLASSFAVRNSDFWLHLAGGRLLAEGRYQFGVDPFAFTTENHYWANQSWLFDVLVFLLYNHFGGTILVVLKALLISLLAIVLMRVRRPLSGMSWPAACTLLAVLAMSPQLLLQSTCLSYVFVGLTLWLLVRPRELSATLRQQLRHDAPVLLLFVLWVNMDSWFLLGPLLVGLFWLGERLFPNRSVGDAILYTPGWLWGASLAVCFLNPHHAHAFTLPVELMPLPDALRHDVRFEPLHSTPWRMIRYYHPLAGVNWASCAYLVLLAVGALSFPLNTRNVVGWRLLVWLTFGGLSAWVSRTIPFFVIVAAPITALNLQDALSRFKTGSERVEAPSARSRLGRLLRGTPHFSLVLSSMALIILAWPGWLQGFQNAGRHVAWTVQPDSSLRRSAERLHIWHQQGKLSVGRGFLAHPDLVHYCAWFCPEEKGFLDRRLQLFGSVADTYEEICRALNLGLATPGSRPRDSWRSNLRDWGITHLVLYDPSLPRLFPSLQQLATEKSDWTLLEVEGQALLVGWRDGERTLPEGLPPFNAERLAFSARTADEEAMLSTAPAQGSERGPATDDLWSYFGMANEPSSWSTDTAGVLLSYFEASTARDRRQRAQHSFAWAAALSGLPAIPSGCLWRLAVSIDQAPPMPQDLNQQPPALPLLAVRAARNALAQNPEDGNAYLYLGRAYLDLVSRTPERSALGLLAPLVELRHIQIAVALENALRRNPDSLAAHEDLAVLYEGRGFLDAALQHRRAAVRLGRLAGPIPGEDASTFARRLEQGEQAVAFMERRLREKKNEFALRTQNLGSEPYRKAETALSMGLALLALDDILMSTSPVLLGGEGVRLQVRLQMMLGRLDLVRSQLHSPDWQTYKANLGFVTLGTPGNSSAPAFRLPAYEWLLLCQAAADGDYHRAEAIVKPLYNEAEAAVKSGLEIAPTQQLALIVSELRSKMAQALVRELALSSVSQSGLLVTMAHLLRLDTMQMFHRISVPTRELAKDRVTLQLIAGLLALERGQLQAAEAAFKEALTWSHRAPDDLATGMAASLAKTYLRSLTSSPR